MKEPFRYFHSSYEVIRLAVIMYVKYPLSLRNVEDRLAERGIDICHETVRHWRNRFGPMFAAESEEGGLIGCAPTLISDGGIVKPNHFDRMIASVAVAWVLSEFLSTL